MHKSPLILRTCLIIILLLTAGRSHAQGLIHADFTFNMDNSFFASSEFDFRSSFAGQEVIPLQDLVIQDEAAPVKVSGIQATVTYAFDSGSPQVFLGAEQMFASRQLQVDLSIQNVSVDSMIQEEIGGAQVAIRVQVSCQNIHMHLNPAQARVLATLKTGVSSDGKIQLEMPYLEAFWPENAWTADPISCSGAGAAGFGDRIRLRLQDYLKSPQPFSERFRSSVLAKLKTYETQIRGLFEQAREVQLGLPEMRVFILPKKLVLRGGDAFRVLGEMQFIYTVPGGEEITVSGNPENLPDDSTPWQLYLPDGVLAAIKTVSEESGLLHLQKHSAEIAGFQTLMSNFFTKTFAWPELDFYSAKDDFLFDFSTDSPTNIQINPASGPVQGVVQAHIQAHLQAQMTAPKGGKFGTFETPFQSAFLMQIEGTDLHVILSQVGLNLSYKWDPGYALKGGNTYVNTEAIGDNIKTSLVKDGYRMTLSPLPLTQSRTLHATALVNTGPWLRLDWK